jgi:hypothetical protein
MFEVVANFPVKISSRLYCQYHLFGVRDSNSKTLYITVRVDEVRRPGFEQYCRLLHESVAYSRIIGAVNYKQMYQARSV